MLSAKLLATVGRTLTRGTNLLLRDLFSGSNGTDLTARQPDSVWYWDVWQYGGQSGVTWTLNGDNSVSQTANPTGAQGLRSYFAFIRAATQDPIVRVRLTTPASGTFRCGPVARMANNTFSYWTVRINSTNHLLEIVQTTAGSDTVRSSVDMGSLSTSTLYEIELECQGTTIIGRCNGFSCNYTSSTNQTETRVGIKESVTSTDSHSKFWSIEVEPSRSASSTASRIFYAPADNSIATEFDSEATSGSASGSRDATSGQGVFKLTINTSGGTSGERMEFQCKDTGPVQTLQSANNYKNIPDEVYFTGYLFIPSTIIRTGSFWLIMQFKQRDSTAATFPVYAINIGWNGSDMVLELNSNMGVSGEYDSDAADLSTTNPVVPAGQWIRFDYYFKYSSTTTGRIRVWMDNVEIWDFTGIQTIFTTGQDWNAPQFPRQPSAAHYSAGLNPSTSSIYWDNIAMSVGGRLPDDYPVINPV